MRLISRLATAVCLTLIILHGATVRAADNVCAGPAAAGATQIEQDGYRLAYSLAPDQTEVGQQFAMTVRVCASETPFDGALRVDAEMPAHRHGMNYQPKVRKLAPGRFQADGFLFHMSGHWRFKFELTGQDGVVRLGADHQQK